MAENENEVTGASADVEGTADVESTEAPADQPSQPAEDITYHAVEKDGQVTAIWEMQGRKHMRTIDPRSRQGQEILRLYTTEHHDEETASS
jgi:hypothetical protein